MSEKLYTYAAYALVGYALIRNAGEYPYVVAAFVVGQIVFWTWGKVTLKNQEKKNDH